MAVPHAKPGEPISVRPLGPALAQAQTTTLIKTKTLEVIRLVVPAGKAIPTHQVAGKSRCSASKGALPSRPATPPAS